jgi:hypothetical protein
MLNWLKGKGQKKNDVEARYEKDSADMLGGMKSVDLLAEMLKIPETEVELPEQFVARGFEDGRIYVSNTAGEHGLEPGTSIAGREGLPPRRAESDGLESIALADLSAWIARRRK